MEKKIVLRLKWYIKQVFIDGENIEEIEISINRLIQNHIANLLNQTNQNYICFIEYHPRVEEVLFKKIEEAGIVLPANIMLTKEIKVEVKKMFTREYLEVYSKILFVRVNQVQLYDREFIDKLQKYNIPEGIRVIRFKEAYQYYFNLNKLYENTESGEGCFNYAYACDLEEYFKHFCIYDYYFPEVLERNYEKMPNVYLEDKVLLTFQETKNIKKIGSTLKIIEEPDASLIFKNFIKKGSEQA